MIQRSRRSLVENPDYGATGRSASHSVTMGDVHQNPPGLVRLEFHGGIGVPAMGVHSCHWNGLQLTAA